MFNLVTVEDTVLIPARLFGHSTERAVENVINRRMSDRVLPSVGLVIAVWDILSLSNDRILRGLSSSAIDVRFRLLVFSPFVGEALFAKVGYSTHGGILAYLGFFDPVWIPRDHLPRPSTFEIADKVWVWRPSFGGPEPMEYFMDTSTETVVRVTAVDFEHTRPPAKAQVSDEPSRSHVMTVRASLYDAASDDNQGLGDPSWWYEEQEEEGEEEGDFDQPEEENVDEQADQQANGEDYEEQWVEEDPEAAAGELVVENPGDAAVDAEEMEE